MHRRLIELAIEAIANLDTNKHLNGQKTTVELMRLRSDDPLRKAATSFIRVFSIVALTDRVSMDDKVILSWQHLFTTLPSLLRSNLEANFSAPGQDGGPVCGKPVGSGPWILPDPQGNDICIQISFDPFPRRSIIHQQSPYLPQRLPPSAPLPFTAQRRKLSRVHPLFTRLITTIKTIDYVADAVTWSCLAQEIRSQSQGWLSTRRTLDSRAQFIYKNRLYIYSWPR